MGATGLTKAPGGGGSGTAFWTLTSHHTSTMCLSPCTIGLHSGHRPGEYQGLSFWVRLPAFEF